MPDEVITQTETVAGQVNTQGEKPVVDTEEFDKERAMKTIKELREFEKSSKLLSKKLAEYEAKEKERQDAELSETDKLKKQLAEAQTALQKQGHESLQRQAAEEVGIPTTFAKRLIGETLDDLKADAELILKDLPKKGAPNVNPTNPGSNADGEKETVQQRLARIHGSAVNMLDPAQAARHGGGAFATTKTE